MWRFYGRVLVGFPKALWDASDWWARTVELALVAGMLAPGLADMSRGTLTANLYWITLASFLTLVLFGMLRANYQAALNEQVAPRLAVSLDEPRSSPDGTRKFVRLRVDNEGHGQVADCQGKLLDIKPLQEVSVTLPEPGQNLTWSSRGSDVPGVRRSIAPKSHEYLDVAFADDFLGEYGSGDVEATAAIHARVQQLLDDPCHSSLYFTFLDWKAWRLPQGAYDVTIEVSAANVGTPALISFRLVYEGGLNLYAAA